MFDDNGDPLGFQTISYWILVFYAIAITTTIARLGHRWYRHQLYWDDFWAFVSLIATILILVRFCIASLIVLKTKPVVVQSFVIWMVHFMHPTAVWASRLSIGVTIVRFLSPGKMRYISKAGCISLVVLYGIVVVQKVFMCGMPVATPYHCTYTTLTPAIGFITNFLANAWLICWPVYILLHMHLPTTYRRLMVACFSTSLIVGATNIAYDIYFLNNNYYKAALTAHFQVSLALFFCNILVLVSYIYRVLREPCLPRNVALTTQCITLDTTSPNGTETTTAHSVKSRSPDPSSRTEPPVSARQRKRKWWWPFGFGNSGSDGPDRAEAGLHGADVKQRWKIGARRQTEVKCPRPRRPRSSKSGLLSSAGTYSFPLGSFASSSSGFTDRASGWDESYFSHSHGTAHVGTMSEEEKYYRQGKSPETVPESRRQSWVDVDGKVVQEKRRSRAASWVSRISEVSESDGKKASDGGADEVAKSSPSLKEIRRTNSAGREEGYQDTLRSFSLRPPRVHTPSSWNRMSGASGALTDVFPDPPPFSNAASRLTPTPSPSFGPSKSGIQRPPISRGSSFRDSSPSTPSHFAVPSSPKLDIPDHEFHANSVRYSVPAPIPLPPTSPRTSRALSPSSPRNSMYSITFSRSGSRSSTPVLGGRSNRRSSAALTGVRMSTERFTVDDKGVISPLPLDDP